MAVITYENVNPSLIENTTMQKGFRDGVHQVYVIAPVDGYVLHDKARDWEEEDPETLEMVTKLGYTGGSASCGANYDFTANPREFYAVPRDSVDENYIFGGGDNDHVTI